MLRFFNDFNIFLTIGIFSFLSHNRIYEVKILSEKLLRMGIDVGSTTVKILILDTDKNEVLYNQYERHHAEQWNTAQRL